MHGHIEWLLDQKVDAIFYPDMSYNVEEGLGSIISTAPWWPTIPRC